MTMQTSTTFSIHEQTKDLAEMCKEWPSLWNSDP